MKMKKLKHFIYNYNLYNDIPKQAYSESRKLFFIVKASDIWLFSITILAMIAPSSVSPAPKEHGK